MGFFSFIGDIFDAGVDLIGDVFEGIGDVLEDIVSWFAPDIPDLESQYGGTLVNKSSNIAQIPVIYGTRKIGGTRAFVETSTGGTHEFLYIALVLCEGEVDSIQEVYIDDELAMNASGAITTLFASNLWINKYTGTTTQTSDSLLSEAPSWGSTHTLNGVTYLACKLKWNKDVYSSLPTITAIVKGRKVYQPELDSTKGGSGPHRESTPSTWTWSQNPSYCLLDYLRNDRFGKGLPTTAFDSNYQSWQDAAAKCDDTTGNTIPGGTIPRFWCNANLDTNAKLIDNVKTLLSGMRGLLPWVDGQYKLIVEDLQTTTEAASNLEFGLDQIIGGITINGMSKRDRYNKVVATFPNPDTNWQLDTVEFPEESSSLYTDWLAEDQGFKLEKRVSLNTITNYYQAKDIAELFARKSREALRCSFRASSEAIQVQVGDVIEVTHPTPGWANKPFRVMNLTLNLDGTVNLTCLEHQDNIYPWSTKPTAPSYSDTNLPNPYFVGPPLSLVVTENLSLPTAALDVSWSASTDSFVTKYTVEYLSPGATVYTSAGSLDRLFMTVTDLVPGNYRVRVKAENVIGSTSAYVTSAVVVVTGSPVMPDVTNLVVVDASTTVANEFTGRDAKFNWSDFNATLQDPLLFSDYVVEIRKVDNTLVRSEAVHDSEYVYTYEKNVEDNAGSPLRQLRINVKQRGNRGQLSINSAKIGTSVSGANPYPNNPAPAVPSGNVNATFNTMYMFFSAPTDTDFTGYKVWASKATGVVTTSDTELVYKGNDNLIIINEVDDGTHTGTMEAIIGNETIYFVYAAYDAFGESGLNKSTEGSTTTSLAPTGGIQTYYEPLANVTCDSSTDGALLFDTTTTTGNNKPYRCNGTTWEIVNDLAISDSQIVANTITAASIAVGTITGNEIDVNNISAYHVNVGSSATTGARMNITSTTIKIYDATNTTPRITIGDLS